MDVYVAQLSGLDLGREASLFGRPLGSRYKTTRSGLITEVKHNTQAGTTSVRLVYVAPGASDAYKEELIDKKAGTIKSYPYESEVTYLD